MATVPNLGQEFVLMLSCPDKPGIVCAAGLPGPALSGHPGQPGAGGQITRSRRDFAAGRG